MDVIALAQAGFGEAVAPLGTALTEAQLERLWRLADVPILCFDGDAAGQKAAIRAATRALPHAGARAAALPSSPCPPAWIPTISSAPRAPPPSPRCSKSPNRWSIGYGRTSSPPSRSTRRSKRPGSSSAIPALPRQSPMPTSAPSISLNSIAASMRSMPGSARPSSRSSARKRKPGQKLEGARHPRHRRRQGRPRRRNRPDSRQGGARRPDPPPGGNRPPYGGSRRAEARRWGARPAVRSGY